MASAKGPAGSCRGTQPLPSMLQSKTHAMPRQIRQLQTFPTSL